MKGKGWVARIALPNFVRVKIIMTNMITIKSPTNEIIAPMGLAPFLTTTLGVTTGLTSVLGLGFGVAFSWDNFDTSVGFGVGSTGAGNPRAISSLKPSDIIL